MHKKTCTFTDEDSVKNQARNLCFIAEERNIVSSYILNGSSINQHLASLGGNYMGVS